MSTSISWTDETWNPVTGCSRVSEGCRNCYAAALAPRLAAMGQKGYTDLPWTAKNAPENVHLHPDRLEKPLRWRKPRRAFVNSMSDLFHELVPDEFIGRVFAVMALAPQHTFQILTKRPERMAEYCSTPAISLGFARGLRDHGVKYPAIYKALCQTKNGLPNVWLGTSVENQKAADERIPHLLRTPAAVRFLSCEPLLGPVLLDNGTHSYLTCNGSGRKANDGYCCDAHATTGECFRGVDWVITGGESGSGFRPMDMDWARSLRDQCKAATVAFFFKQHSGLRPPKKTDVVLLDGEEWHQFPEVCS